MVAASGGVAQDERGFRGAWHRTYDGISDPLTIKALAFRDSVVLPAKKVTRRSLVSQTVSNWCGYGMEGNPSNP